MNKSDDKILQTNIKFDKSNKVIILLAMSIIPCPFLYNFIVYNFDNSIFVSIFLPILFFITGYGIQILFSKILNYQQIYNHISYESEKFYKIKQIIPSGIISLLCSLIVYILTDRYLIKISIGNKYSLIPLMVFGIVFISMTMGNIFWFYPQQSLIRNRIIFNWILTFFIGYMITVIYGLQETIPILLIFLNPVNFFVNLFGGSHVNLFGILSAAVYIILISVAYKRNKKHYKIYKRRRRGKYDYDV